MSLSLKQIRVGKVDGKHEYLTPVKERDSQIFDAFLIPESVEPDRMNNGDVFFVEGFRGTGKTSLLRWHAEQNRKLKFITDFILFKTDLTESQRLHISNEVGISWVDLSSTAMEISQDFKAAWHWFILHKIGENIRNNITLFAESDKNTIKKIFTLLGIEDDSTFKKAIGFMPKLEGAHVKIRANIGFFESELGGDFKPDGNQGKTTLDSLCRKITLEINNLKLSTPIFIYFDELEAFYHSTEQHRRDQRMVRDLLFSISSLNDNFRSNNTPIHIIAAVRSEVIDAMGSLGQEIDRLVHDRGFLISWHHANRSINHPLIQIIKRKIEISESNAGLAKSTDPITTYFPKSINGEPVEVFLLDKSFYKPRDIVWRLSLAQKLFPNESRFTQDVLHETEMEYSSKLWDEIRYELSATYSDDEVNSIEAVMSGGSSAFEFDHIEERFNKMSKQISILRDLINRRSVKEILTDLYRLGAIGNSFRAGPTGTDIRNRWSFRGDPTLLSDKRMTIHPALLKRLSAVPTRKRGTRARK